MGIGFCRWWLLSLALGVAAHAQPNVVVIVADDVGFGDVGYLGSEIRTPNLDRMATEGLVLDRFYASSQCTPSRAGLLTGRYGVRMRLNEAIGRTDTVGIPLDEVTLAEYLGEAGYETAMVGKWHLGDRCHQIPTRHGFESFLGLLGSGAFYFTRETPVGMDWWRDTTPEDVPGYTTDLIADEAIEIIGQRRDRPLFLYLPFTASHGPLGAPEDEIAAYGSLPEPRRSFAAVTTHLDAAVGRVMEAVRASGEPTLVWFLSDNGGHEASGGSNLPLQGRKGLTQEGGIRVPSIVWYPEWGAGRVEHPVWYLDILPTVLAMVPEAPALRRPIDGDDQSAQLAGAPPTADLLDRILYSYRRIDVDTLYWLSAQTATWKFTRQPSRFEPREFLYRIDLDPTERSDSLAAYPEIAATLREGADAFKALTMPGAGVDLSLIGTPITAYDISDCPAPMAPEPTPGTPPITGLTLRVGPNPFTVATTLRVRSEAAGPLRVDLVDTRGRTVRTLFRGRISAQAETPISIGRGGLPSGTYIVRAASPSGQATARVTLVR